MSYDSEGNEQRWIWDRGDYTLIEPNFLVSSLNDRGVVSGGYLVPGAGASAALWDDGEVTVIGPPFSIASASTRQGEVVGTLDTNSASRAFVWKRGQLTPLPALRADQVGSFASGINQRGLISGITRIQPPGGTVDIPTFWIDGQPVDVNTLIHPDDPLRPYVTLHSATAYDNGDVLASGSDSRLVGVQRYLLTPRRR